MSIVEVYLWGVKVGALGYSPDQTQFATFEYDKDFIKRAVYWTAVAYVNRNLIKSKKILFIFKLSKTGVIGNKDKGTSVEITNVNASTIVETVSATGKIQPEIEVKIASMEDKFCDILRREFTILTSCRAPTRHLLFRISALNYEIPCRGTG